MTQVKANVFRVVYRVRRQSAPTEKRIYADDVQSATRQAECRAPQHCLGFQLFAEQLVAEGIFDNLGVCEGGEAA